MRIATILLATVMAVGLGASAPADEVAPPGDVDQSTPDYPAALDAIDQSTADDDDYVPCGCGGPKAIYAAKYGTVQPPIMQQQQQEREAAEAAAAANQNEPSETDADDSN